MKIIIFIVLCNILLFSSSCNAASGMHNNDGKSSSSDYFYMVTGVGVQCESFKDTIGGRIDNTIDCDYAREGTGYCKEYHNGDNHYDTNGVYKESKSSYPEGCYCKSTAPDHEYIITLNSRASGKDCDNEYCLCISRTKDYVVKGGARCENKNFIQTEEACLASAKKNPGVCGFKIKGITHTFSSQSNMPYGCYCKSDKVYFNNNTDDKSNSCKNADGCFCYIEKRDKGTCVKETNGTQAYVKVGDDDCNCCINDVCGSNEDCAALRAAATLIGTILLACCCGCCIFGIVCTIGLIVCRHQSGTSMPRRAPATTQPPQMVQRTQMINVQKPNQMQPNPIANGMNQPQMQPAVAMNPNQNMMMQGQQPQMMQGQVMAINPNQNMMMGGQPQMQQQVVVNAVPMNK